MLKSSQTMTFENEGRNRPYIVAGSISPLIAVMRDTQDPKENPSNFCKFTAVFFVDDPNDARAHSGKSQQYKPMSNGVPISEFRKSASDRVGYLVISNLGLTTPP